MIIHALGLAQWTASARRPQLAWHFVYSEYEIACYAIGAVEVVVKLAEKAEEGT